MGLREIRAGSLLRRSRRVDSWFLSGCGMNLYRGCAHDCAYCDGRAEKYAVEGEFAREVAVKVNAPELLRRELGASRGAGPAPAGYVLLGGGVGDSYQPAEQRYGLARRALELLLELGRPVHVLTKSVLVERDLDLLLAIQDRSRAILSMSFSSVDEGLSALLEPGAAAPAARLRLLERAGRAGLPTGVFLMPVLPFLTDSEEALGLTLRRAAEAGARFVVFGGLTLKAGRQQEHFLSVLRGLRPELEPRYRRLFPGDRWGRAAGGYYAALERRFAELARGLGLAPRLPPALYAGLLGPVDRAVVVLEHLDYLLRLRGQRSCFGGAARCVARRPELAGGEGPELFPREGGELEPAAAEVLAELRRTGGCALLQRLLAG